jgi:hypothetical protein
LPRRNLSVCGDDMVTISVSGEGSFIGGETIFANPLRAEAGITTALVRKALSRVVTASYPSEQQHLLCGAVWC